MGNRDSVIPINNKGETTLPTILLMIALFMFFMVISVFIIKSTKIYYLKEKTDTALTEAGLSALSVYELCDGETAPNVIHESTAQTDYEKAKAIFIDIFETNIGTDYFSDYEIVDFIVYHAEYLNNTLNIAPYNNGWTEQVYNSSTGRYNTTNIIIPSPSLTTASLTDTPDGGILYGPGIYVKIKITVQGRLVYIEDTVGLNIE